MPVYNLIEYIDNYSKTSAFLWQNYWDKLEDILTNSESFKLKIKITWKTPAAGNTKGVKRTVLLKDLRMNI